MGVPRPRPPHLVSETTRHGETVWYYRRGQGKRIRIRGDYGSEEFMAAYRAADAGAPLPVKKGDARTDSVKWLIELYRESAPWKAYSHGTRRQREPILNQIIASAGADHKLSVTRGTIVAGRDKRAATPAQATHFLETVRGLYGWAVDAGHMPYDPTAGVKDPKRKKSGGFKIWREEWVQQYEKRWPLGTRERVWLAVIMYSGLRRSDAARYGRQHISGGMGPIGVRGGLGTIKLQKGGELIEVFLPVLPELAKVLEAGPIGDLTFVTGDRGLPLTKETFGNYFREACVTAKVPGRAHGLRKLAATRAANNGASDKALQALFGWTDYKMPQLYTKSADRRRLAIEHADLIAPAKKNEKRSSIPAPVGKVRDFKPKGQ